MIGTQVEDLLDTSRAAIEAANPTSVDDVRSATKPLVGFSEPMQKKHLAMKQFCERSSIVTTASIGWR